jgi:hypothetical protein
MKSIFRFNASIICVLAFTGSIATAQDLQQQLTKLGKDAAVGYTSPLLSGFGNDLNSGIYYSADLHEVLGFDIGVKFAMSKITDADKTYNLTIPSMSVDPTTIGINAVNVNGVIIAIPAGSNITLTSGVNYPSSITANSAVGPKDNTIVNTIGGSQAVISSSNPLLNGKTITLPSQPQQILLLPGGFDFGALGVPLPMPQLNLGLPFGLEFMLRYFPTTSYKDAGKFNYMGFGLRYSIDQWIPLCPVDLAVHFMTQKLTFKSSSDQDIFTGTATAYGVEVSKKLFIITLYGGFQMESSTLTLADYTYAPDPTLPGVTIPGFEIKGSDKSRFTVGARLLLLFINLHADYSVATNNVLTLGAGITIR